MLSLKRKFELIEIYESGKKQENAASDFGLSPNKVPVSEIESQTRRVLHWGSWHPTKRAHHTQAELLK